MNNNPVRYADPTGHMVSDGLVGEGGGCDRQCWDERNPSPAPKPSKGGGGGSGDEATSSLGEVFGGSKGPGLNSLVQGNGGITYTLSEEDIVYLSEHYEDIGQLLGGFALLDALAGLFCFYYCQPALPVLALGFALIANESVQALRISDALEESAHWADQQEFEFARIVFNENEVLLFDQISYTDDLGYIQTNNIYSLFLGSLIQNDLNNIDIPLPIIQ